MNHLSQTVHMLCL